jgi:hypothetical protein
MSLGDDVTYCQEQKLALLVFDLYITGGLSALSRAAPAGLQNIALQDTLFYWIQKW